MANQFSQHSVKIYRLSPDGFSAARNRLLKQRALVFLGIVVFLFVLVYKMFGPSWQWNSIASFLPASFVVVLCLAAMGFGLRKGIKQNREYWDTFELLIGEDFVIRRIRDFPELEIRRDEVTRIRETANGLCVQTKLKDRTIGISRDLIDYQDAKEKLARWTLPVTEPPQGWNSPRHWIWLAPVVTIVLFAVFFFATTNWMIVSTGVPLLIFLSASIWLTHRSVQVSARAKRLSLLAILPMLAMVAKLFLAIRHWGQ